MSLGRSQFLGLYYFPDIALSEYHIFRTIRHYLIDKKFIIHDEVNKVIILPLKLINFYELSIKMLLNKLKKVISNDRNYILE